MDNVKFKELKAQLAALHKTIDQAAAALEQGSQSVETAGQELSTLQNELLPIVAAVNK